MKILMLASEFAPFASAGTMGEAIANLSKALRAQQHEVEVVLPLYRSAREAAAPRKTRQKFTVAVGDARYPCQIFEGRTPDGTRTYFIGRDEFFDRSGLYGADGTDYQDNSARFIFFVKAALELARRMDPPPDVIHAHGWQAALAGVFTRHAASPTQVVLTPHGLDFQGNFWSYDFGLTNLPGEYFSAKGLEFYGSMNFLKAGLLFSSAIVLPDERFACAAQTAAFGCGLENVLREHASKIWGIPDGTSLEGWHPARDTALSSRYDSETLHLRQPNKVALLERFGWSDGPTLACFTAMVKPSPLLFESLDRLLATGARLALLGPLPGDLTRPYILSARRHAHSFVHLPEPSEADARQILAGTDFLLLPEETTNCQPWLLRALRYGAIPIARHCPGLHQFVTERTLDRGNGFLFWKSTPSALIDACRKAFSATADTETLAAATRASMSADFSLQASASAHTELYAQATGLAPKALAA